MYRLIPQIIRPFLDISRPCFPVSNSGNPQAHRIDIEVNFLPPLFAGASPGLFDIIRG
jgi:hypothetical protein